MDAKAVWAKWIENPERDIKQLASFVPPPTGDEAVEDLVVDLLKITRAQEKFDLDCFTIFGRLIEFALCHNLARALSMIRSCNLSSSLSMSVSIACQRYGLPLPSNEQMTRCRQTTVHVQHLVDSMDEIRELLFKDTKDWDVERFSLTYAWSALSYSLAVVPPAATDSQVRAKLYDKLKYLLQIPKFRLGDLRFTRDRPWLEKYPWCGVQVMSLMMDSGDLDDYYFADTPELAMLEYLGHSLHGQGVAKMLIDYRSTQGSQLTRLVGLTSGSNDKAVETFERVIFDLLHNYRSSPLDGLKRMEGIDSSMVDSIVDQITKVKLVLHDLLIPDLANLALHYRFALRGADAPL